jgi:threonine dehydrogenase-like Zn-dependent dehydrogenase
MGHEYVGIVEEVGREVRNIKPGQFVVGSFFASDNTCPICRSGYQGRCVDAERIILMSRHEDRQKLGLEFGASDIVTERGDEGVARIKDMTDGLGAHSVIEAVGTQVSTMQAIRSTRPGGHVGFVGVSHGVEIPGLEVFFSEVHLHGGPAPVRRYLPELIDLIWNRQISPGSVFDLTLPLAEVAEGYRAMDERRAIKTLLRP